VPAQNFRFTRPLLAGARKLLLQPLRSFLLIWLAIAFGSGQHTCWGQPTPKPLDLHAPVQDKNFYLLSLLQANPRVRTILAQDPALARLAAERAWFQSQALATCKENACRVRAFLWTEEEIQNVSFSLARLSQQSAPVRKLVETDLRPSGAYVIDDRDGGAILLESAWQICARGLNDILSVYGEGMPPRYPKIDSSSFDVTSPDVQSGVAALLQAAAEQAQPSQLFFAPSLRAALQLLALNHRDEAGRLEPMEQGVNEAAVKAIPSLPWSRYPYSVIVVPGAGPDNPDTPISAAGRARVALAAEAYHAGKAPLILLSGGYVHPAQTRFAEAIEMKKVLLAEYHLPEAAVLVDPHARHTTTNMRNAAREIFRDHLPMNKPALVVTDAAQTGYIAGQPFADRCLKELGYLPYQIVSRPSSTSLVFLPRIDSLQQDPLDPLDP
jgi:hypothetical protein